MLKRTLWSIDQQNYPRENIQVIVVSQTPQILQESLTEYINVGIEIYIRPENETISALRNYGVNYALGLLLAFLDADIELSPNWISQMLQELEQRNRIIVSAMQIPNINASPLEKVRTQLSNAELDSNVNFLPGRNLLMLKSSFDQIGGFPEHLITCEDYYFTDQASKLGKLYYTSSATYIHLGEDKRYKDMFKKEIWRGQSNLQSIKGRKIPLREIPSFVLPIWIVSCLVLALFFSLFVVKGNIAIGLFLFGALPILAYSMRLFSLAKGKLDFGAILKFYLYYFPARALGTMVGLVKSIGTNHK